MTDKKNEKKNEIIVKPMDTEKLNFPKAPSTVSPTTEESTQLAIGNNAVMTTDGKTAINTKALTKVLHTDKPGAKRFYSDLDDEDKFKSGGQNYVRTPALRKEVDERIEKPHDAKKREQLRYSSDCLAIVRDNQESERIRAVDEVKIRVGQKSLKKKKIERDGTTYCEHSRELLKENAEAHHNVRRADDPDKALDLDNISILNPEIHKKHHEEERKAANEESESETIAL